MTVKVRLDSLFTIKYGQHELNSKENLGEGNTIVISSKGVDNGCYGFFDVDKKYEKNVISVPRTGTIGESFVQTNPCSIDDNCLVLTPRKKLSLEYLFYISSKIRLEKWRYAYGRQITPHRIGRLQVIDYDDFKPPLSFSKLKEQLTPQKDQINNKKINPIKIKEVQITKLFDLHRGHFHAIDRLITGRIPTISRVSDDNGLVGFYERPKKAKIFPKLLITVSTVTGDAFLQYTPFIATDNVVICVPKSNLKLTTLIYIQAAINKAKWRYSYGRQCYKGTLQKTMLFLPLDTKDNLDEEYIEKLVTNTPFWNALKHSLIEKY